jgi:hypothetical protein
MKNRPLISVMLRFALVSALAGCGKAGYGYTVLTRAVTNGIHWQLDAEPDSSGLCMRVDSPKGPDVDVSWGSGGCGFNADPPDGSYYLTGPVPGSAGADTPWLTFGPLPSNATAIRIATHQVVKTYPFPRGHGLPDGRFWLFVRPPGWPTKSEGTLLDTPQPLDRAGRPVSFKRF